MEKIKVLFVCLGNICRSPLAEAVFKHKVKEKGVEHRFQIDSCGTANYHIGDKPDSRTIANALKNGVSIDHFGRQLCTDDLSYYDLILVMDNSNLRFVQALTTGGDHAHKIKLLRSYDTVEKGGEVPDPYYGTEHSFQNVFDILDRNAGLLLDDILSSKK